MTIAKDATRVSVSEGNAKANLCGIARAAVI